METPKDPSNAPPEQLDPAAPDPNLGFLMNPDTADAEPEDGTG